MCVSKHLHLIASASHYKILIEQGHMNSIVREFGLSSYHHIENTAEIGLAEVLSVIPVATSQYIHNLL